MARTRHKFTNADDYCHERIDEAIVEIDLSIETIARRARVNPRTIRTWRSGARSPSVGSDDFKRFARAINKPVKYLLRGEE